MEALYIQPFEEDRGEMEEDEREKSGEQEEASCGSTTDEETDEDSEPDPRPVTRRKVSFADAFGLNLVSVKEFDNVEMTESEVSKPPERDATHQLEEFYMSRLFTVPSSPEELDQRLQAQPVALESIELLPGTTTLRGNIRVVNLCYSKSVYARVTLDRWNSHFDLLAEYVPGSSDMKTDRFTFMYTLVPPAREGIRVEFCLCYDTSVGTFWSNNKGMNYVLFCNQKGQGPQVQEESTGKKSKRSCLRANRRGSADEKTREAINTATVAKEAPMWGHEAEEAVRKTMDRAEIQSLLYHEEHKPLVDSIKSQHRGARLEHVQDFISQRRQQVSTPKPLPTMWDDPASSLQKRNKKPSNESLQVLTYHQIPLLTLDWNNEKPQQWTADVDDIWTGRAKMAKVKASKEHIKDTPSVNDMWETFLNGTDHTTDEETSVCDVWQAFLNGPSCKDHSGVPESEWLQTAASVSPSNDKEPQTQYAASRQEHEFQACSDTPTTLQALTSAACQLLSGTRDTAMANVALNAKDHQPEEAFVSGPRGDTATRDASQRSQTNSVTDTPQEFSFRGATPFPMGSVNRSTEYHKDAIQEIIGGAGGIGGDKPSTPHMTELVTCSGELKTTEMTEMAESQNASAGDRISQGARLDEGLSYSREGEFTGTAHNAPDDTLAFRETIREGINDGERFAFPASRLGVEEGITTYCTENKVSTEEEIFRPQCEISQRYADEKQCKEFRLNQNRENALKQEKNENEIRAAQSHADEFNLNQTCQKNIRQSQIMGSELKLDESEYNKDVDGFGQKEVETSDCTTSEKRIIGETDMIRLLVEETEEERQTDEGISLSYSGIIQEKQAFQNDTFRPFPTDKCNPNPMEELETRWSHSQEHMKGQIGYVGEISTREVTVKENVEKKDTSTELQHQPEKLNRIEEGKSQRDRDERVSIGKLEIEAVGELMGNVENLQGESENAPAELKEQEFSAEVESSPRVEYRKLSEGTKDPITAENTVALEVIESGLEEMFIDRFVEDLVGDILEDVFCQRGNLQASSRDTNIVDGVASKLKDILDITHDCHLSEKDLNDDFDSGVFSLTELPTDPNITVCQGLEQTIANRSDEFSPSETGQSLAETEPTHFKVQTDSDSSACLSQDLIPTLVAQRRQSSTESAQSLSSPKDQGNYTQIKERSVIRQETGRQIEDCILVHRERFNQSGHPSPKHWSPSSKKLEASDGLLWWSILYILSHITRVLTCGLLVVGFFIVIFLYDFPALFALYIS